MIFILRCLSTGETEMSWLMGMQRRIIKEILKTIVQYYPNIYSTALILN